MTRREQSAAQWAQEEFGRAQLDYGNDRRLVDMAAQVARHPAGRVTKVFPKGAPREGAYGFLRNERVSVEAIAEAAHQAAVTRCKRGRVAIVPVDPSSLSFPDPEHTKGSGPVGARKKKTRGFNVISALVILRGVVMGIAAQRWWTRPERKRKKHRDSLPLQKKESWHWIVVLEKVVAHFVALATHCRPWFQLDRGGDIAAVLQYAIAKKWLLTARAQHDRVVLHSGKRLRTYMRQQRVAGYLEVEIPGRPGRQKRTATLAVRFHAQVTFVVTDQRTHRKSLMTLPVVHAREVGTCPRGEKPIEWYLLTTRGVRTFAAAVRVLTAYASRYWIEEYHNTWKSGLCDVEDVQLRDESRIKKWATLLSSVATRALRIMHLARQAPETPASEEFTQDEIDAVILLRKPRGVRRGHVPPLGTLIEWVAELGGYTGK